MHILWLKTELLHPVDKGGKIRTYHMLKAFKREHRVTYLTLDDGTAARGKRAGQMFDHGVLAGCARAEMCRDS